MQRYTLQHDNENDDQHIRAAGPAVVHDDGNDAAAAAKAAAITHANNNNNNGIANAPDAGVTKKRRGSLPGGMRRMPLL
jgi:hypothetical protein